MAQYRAVAGSHTQQRGPTRYSRGMSTGHQTRPTGDNPAKPTGRRGAVTWFSVTDACNAHCAFCAEHVPRLTDDLRSDAVLKRLEQALLPEPPQEVLLTGGEPTLHPRLATVIERCRSLGVERVVLFTNGMALADPRRLEAYVAAGLTAARVSLFGVEDDATAATRHPRAWELASAGVDAAVAAGLELQLATVVNGATLSHLPRLAETIAARWPTAKRVTFRPYVSRPPNAPDGLHLRPAEMMQDLSAALAHLAAASISVAPDPGYGFHLCAFPKPRKFSGVLRRGQASGAGQLTLLAGCHSCALKERCGGVETSFAGVFGESVITPVTDARRATWLPVFERTAASERTDRIDVIERRGSDDVFREQVIRILHACNQRCAFCWVDFDAATMTVEEVRAAIEQNIRRADGQPVTIAYTGGEPMLHPSLVELVQLATDLGAARVHVQTNAVKAAKGTLAQRLAAAGLREALVSLHAHRADKSDTLTAAPGTFERTVAGIRNLCDAGVDVVINHVLTEQLARDFPDFVRFVASELAHDRLVVTLAVAGRIDRGPLDDSVLPRLSSLAEPVLEGLLLARELGVTVRDLVHPCGIAPCILGGDPRVFDRATMRKVATRGVVGESEGCVKPTSCRSCIFDDYCFGIRREYADEYGTDELVPVVAPPPSGTDIE